MRRVLESSLTLFLVALLISFIYAYLFRFPYLGFQESAQSEEIVDLFTSQDGQARLEIGDRVLKINGLSFAEFNQDWRLPFPISGDGEIDLVVIRNGEQLSVSWQSPGFNVREFTSRFVNVWWVGLVFTSFGILTMLLVRPRDRKRDLLIALCYLTAIWIVAGTISRTRFLLAPYAMSAAMWFSMPVYLHFHWLFPKALPQNRLTKIFGIGLYASATIGALNQWFLWFTKFAYSIPLVVAFFGSGAILVFRAVWRKRGRAKIRILAFATLVAFLPLLIIALLGNPPTAIFGAILSMLALPGAYFYLIYRSQISDLEFRINRLISAYLFALLLMVMFLLTIPAIPISAFSNFEVVAVVVLLSTGAALLTVFLFEPFQRFVEARVLKIPLPSKALLEDMSRSISTSLTMEKLNNQLQERIFPSLLVRESLLLALNRKDQSAETLINYGLLPAQEGVWQLAELKGSEGHPGVKMRAEVVALDDLSVVWLFGKRDPDDNYHQSETEVIAVLARQLGVALTNIDQASKLRALYQANISREEGEKKRLARDLHDDVLNQIAQLFMGLDEPQKSETFQEDYKALTSGLRATIHELRPPMLSFGLWAALKELFEEGSTRSGANCEIKFQLKKSECRYSEAVEENVYRIVQQALENSLKHAQAHTIRLEGILAENSIQISLVDDGVGMETKATYDLVQLLSDRHYGLAGMHERAELIKASLAVKSSRGGGTSIQIAWESKD